MGDLNTQSLTANAKRILGMLGKRNEAVLMLETDDMSLDQAAAVHEALWSDLLASCLVTQEAECVAWVDYLFMVGSQDESPHRLGEDYGQAIKGMGAWLHGRGIDSRSLSLEWTAAYRATVAALLPRFRQRQLECTFDVSTGSVSSGPEADYSPMGQKAFFMIGQRLLLQRILAWHGLRFPVFITRYLDCLDADWRFAIWRMILSASSPVLILAPSEGLPREMMALLHQVDWSVTPDTPHFGMSTKEGLINFVPLGKTSGLWLEENTSRRMDNFIPPWLIKVPD